MARILSCVYYCASNQDGNFVALNLTLTTVTSEKSLDTGQYIATPRTVTILTSLPNCNAMYVLL